jgi:hypothetical protein
MLADLPRSIRSNPQLRIEMKTIAMLLMLCAWCGSVSAQTSECQSIAKASERLACYDRIAPPTSRGKPGAASQTIEPERDQATDSLSAENARLDAKINNICRGC